MKKIFSLEKLQQIGVKFLKFIAVVMFIAWWIGLFIYPAFSILFLVTAYLTVPACFHGYLDFDFTGLAMVPYLIISLGIYTISFIVLHILKYLGHINFEIQWTTLSIVGIIAVVITFIVCWSFNRPKEKN